MLDIQEVNKTAIIVGTQKLNVLFVMLCTSDNNYQRHDVMKDNIDLKQCLCTRLVK